MLRVDEVLRMRSSLVESLYLHEEVSGSNILFHLSLQT
jgi:hypothetical protein